MEYRTEAVARSGASKLKAISYLPDSPIKQVGPGFREPFSQIFYQFQPSSIDTEQNFLGCVGM